MTRIKRNRLLIWVIFLGLANFVSYTVTYWYVAGDARNGKIEDDRYYVRGHHLRRPTGEFAEVSRGVWIYSYLHSISIWPTIAAVLLSMLVLSRPHIIATMKSGAVISGSTFVTVAMTVVVLVTAASTLYFVLDFVRALN